MKQVAPFLSVNSRDFIKGLLMALIGAIITGTMTSIQAGSLPTDWNAWKPILIAGFVAALTYLSKNFLTNSKDEFLTKEQPK